MNYNQLKEKINSIYFDYCIDNNIKYKELLVSDYDSGFINEDWFVGIKKDGKKEIFYTGNDDRIFKEIEEFTKSAIHLDTNTSVIKCVDENIEAILDARNYQINIEGFKENLKFYETERYDLDGKFLHGTTDLKIISSILTDRKITSSYCGNRMHHGFYNGPYFISLSKKEKGISLKESCVHLPSLVLDSDMCTFLAGKQNFVSDEIATMFTNTSYPIRKSGHYNEYQVLNSISLDKAEAIVVNENSWGYIDIAKILFLLDYLDSNLHLIGVEKEQVIDKNAIKKYIKFTRQ